MQSTAGSRVLHDVMCIGVTDSEPRMAAHQRTLHSIAQCVTSDQQLPGDIHGLP